MASKRMTPDAPTRTLLKVFKGRIEGLRGISQERSHGIERYQREDGITFLQIEVKQDHLLVDLWLPMDEQDDARASGIARAHPFLGEDALRVRFERAEDLAQVTRWMETSFAYVARREGE